MNQGWENNCRTAPSLLGTVSSVLGWFVIYMFDVLWKAFLTQQINWSSQEEDSNQIWHFLIIEYVIYSFWYVMYDVACVMGGIPDLSN